MTIKTRLGGYSQKQPRRKTAAKAKTRDMSGKARIVGKGRGKSRKTTTPDRERKNRGRSGRQLSSKTRRAITIDRIMISSASFTKCDWNLLSLLIISWVS